MLCNDCGGAGTKAEHRIHWEAEGEVNEYPLCKFCTVRAVCKALEYGDRITVEPM